MPKRTILGLLAASVLIFVGGSAAGADAGAGRKLASQCVACHGLDGIGKMPDVPNLAGESAIYLTKALTDYRDGRREHEQMSIIAKSLSDEEIADLAAWYASLKVKVEMPP
jgi:cytochrome c553